MTRTEFARALAGWLLVFPGVWRNCEAFEPVLKKLPSSEGIWLTFDDGPEPRQTPWVLDTLRERGVRATFFVIGEKAERHPELCRRIVAEGHGIGNHTQTHPSGIFWAAGYARARREISHCSESIAAATGTRARFFRAPVGMANPFVHLAARDLGLQLAGWSASGNDGILHNPQRVALRIARAAQPGSIVLLHDSHLPGMQPGDRACALKMVLDRLQHHVFTTP